MSQENPGFRLDATRVASTADRSSADGPAGMSAQQAARGTSFAAPEAGGHLPRSYGFELVEQLADELRQVSLASHAVPAFDRDLEDSDPRLGSQARGSVGEPALAQRASDRRGECGELDQLALLKSWVRGNDS